MTRHVLSAFFLVILFLSGAELWRAGDSQDPAAFIDEFGHRAIATLTAPNLGDIELVKRFEDLFEEGFDVPYLARSALGRFWNIATGAERADYLPLFKEYVSWVYALQFRHYSGETFKVDRSGPGPQDMTSVLSTVVKPDGTATKLEWSVANVDGKLRIRDIKIEGVSMIISYRDQFSSAIQQHGGTVAGLLDALRDKIAELRASGNQ